MNIKLIRTPALLLISVSTMLLGGCATNLQTQSALLHGPTMLQTYNSAMRQSNDTNLNSVRAKVSHAVSTSENAIQVTHSTITPNTATQINSQFPTLPNPNIVIYVYPHLAGPNQMPVRGYYTAIHFYQQIHYAIPGEAGVNDV